MALLNLATTRHLQTLRTTACCPKCGLMFLVCIFMAIQADIREFRATLIASLIAVGLVGERIMPDCMGTQ